MDGGRRTVASLATPIAAATTRIRATKSNGDMSGSAPDVCDDTRPFVPEKRRRSPADALYSSRLHFGATGSTPRRDRPAGAQPVKEEERCRVFPTVATAPKWTTLTSHRAWLLQQAGDLLSFFETRSINPLGGFHELDDEGRPMAAGNAAGPSPSRQLHVTTRMVHCFALAHLLGRPGADAIVDHGMSFLWNGHRDTAHGGYFWGVGYEGPTDDTKQAYGHAFVLLAAASAKAAGHPDADRLLTDISTVLNERFWEDRFGAAAEEFTRDWQSFDQYRGQNSNMHLTEALMAAFEATGDSTYLRMAERIADLIVHRHAAQNGWRLPEHFTADWQLDRTIPATPCSAPTARRRAIGSNGRGSCCNSGSWAAARSAGCGRPRERCSCKP